MAKFCATCTKTGKFGERVEMNPLGSHRVEGERVVVYQCPVCDSVKGEFFHKNGLSTTRGMTSEEVRALPGPGVGLIVIGLLALGAVVAAGSGGKK